MKVVFPIIFGKPNLNKHIYEKENFLEALDTAIQKGLIVYADADLSTPIGKVDTKEVDSDKVFVNCTLSKSDALEFSIASPVVIGTITENEVDVDYVKAVFPITKDLSEYGEY